LIVNVDPDLKRTKAIPPGSVPISVEK